MARRIDPHTRCANPRCKYSQARAERHNAAMFLRFGRYFFKMDELRALSRCAGGCGRAFCETCMVTRDGEPWCRACVEATQQLHLVFEGVEE